MVSLDKIQITQICEIRTVSSLRGKVLEQVERDHYGLSFCTEGQITYTHGEKTCISNPERAILLPKGASYRLYGDKKGCFPLINFECTGLELDSICEIRLQNPVLFLKDYEQMRNLFLFERNRLKVLSIFYDMLSRLSVGQSRQGSLLSSVLPYLEQHLSDPGLSNESLARQIGFSEVYFRKLFTAQMGISPRQYILEVRIRKARQLLEDGVFTVSAIAEECGFTNVYHFSRTFRDRVGMTPTQYMQENRSFHI